MIIIYSGHANVGKTSYFNRAFAELGFTILSNSGLLHEVTTLLIQQLTGCKEFTTVDKTKTIRLVAQDHTENTPFPASARVWSMRSLLITVAEKILVKVFTRSVFSFRTAEQAFELHKNGQNVVIESIGGDELTLMIKYLSLLGYPISDIKMFNARRHTEQPNADSRKLITDALDIWNIGNYDELKESLELFINK